MLLGFAVVLAQAASSLAWAPGFVGTASPASQAAETAKAGPRPGSRVGSAAGSARGSTSPKAPGLSGVALPAPLSEARVCSTLAGYPKADTKQLSFESGEVSALCRARYPALRRERLDFCGDSARDPYSSAYTWPSHEEMRLRGKVNLVRDPEGREMARAFERRIAQIRRESTDFCCADDRRCRAAMDRLDIGYCQSESKPDEPDPCVFGGNYRMPGDAYPTIFAAIDGERFRGARPIDARFPQPGDIRLTAYAPAGDGATALEPTLRHEMGHACSMIRMQLAATDRAPERAEKRARAARWLRGVKDRCDSSAELSDAYGDFWESVGESRELAACFMRLAKLNQAQAIDKPCAKICPGHYLEEAVGSAFSLLTGKADGGSSAAFPNACDHVRDGQHPMVGDVVDCLAQHSPRFRARVAVGQRCATGDGGT